MEILAIARTFNKYGFTKLADKLVVRKYGQQIGKTSNNGGRCFSGIIEPLQAGWATRQVERIDYAPIEKVLTAIDKDYNMVGQTTVRRLRKKSNDITSYDYTQVERLLLPKSNDRAKTCRFDITGFYGKNITSEPGSHVISKHYISRKALVPEVRYGCSKPNGKYNAGDTIYDQFHYSYWPMDRDSNVVNKYGQIGYIYGGESFANKIKKMLDEWHTQRSVVRHNF